MNKKKKKTKLSEYEKTLNPIITIQEDKGEQLFVIADFSIPGNPDVRRIISKQRADGKIDAATYIGTVGADRTCNKKRNLMSMKSATEEQFWESLNVLSELYKAVGGVTEIRNYSGKTIREAAGLMRMLGNAKVWESDPQDQANL